MSELITSPHVKSADINVKQFRNPNTERFGVDKLINGTAMILCDEARSMCGIKLGSIAMPCVARIPGVHTEAQIHCPS